MKLVFAEQAWEDSLHWQATNLKVLKRVNGLMRETTRTPSAGTGNPGVNRAKRARRTGVIRRRLLRRWDAPALKC